MAIESNPGNPIQPATERSGTAIGIGWMVLTGVLFVIVTCIVRYLGSDMPPIEAAFIRYVIGLLLVLPPLVAYFRSRPPVKRTALFGLRGFIHGFAVILWFYAMARIPIAEVTAIGYTAPIFVTIGAALFLGETLHIRRIAAVVCGLLGALIILRPGFQEIALGQLAQLAAAPLFAASFLMAKRLTDHENPAVIVALLSLFCTITLLPGAILQWRQPTMEEVFWLGMTALAATAGHYTMTRALASAPITVTQPITFLQLVWASLLGMLLFGEALDPFVFAGGAVIVAAATYISHRETVAARREVTPPTPATKI
ncbi:MAG: DMT family transporter [Pseudomonadota bacterium]